jgi:DNA mismatch repair protein MutS2
VLVRGKRVRTGAGELQGMAPAAAARPPRPAPFRPDGADDRSEVTAELMLIGQRVEPALEALDDYLDRALLSGRRDVRVVHGHGSGRLREAVRRHLKAHPAVSAIRPGAANEGGNGATVATLRDA